MITVQERSGPVLLCLPHSGEEIFPPSLHNRFSATGRLQTDTAWHLPDLIDFANDLSITVVSTPTCRYVLDVDHEPGRDEGPRCGDSLCPTLSRTRKRIYAEGEEPGPVEIEERRRLFHAPFHNALAAQVSRLKKLHPRVVLVVLTARGSRDPDTEAEIAPMTISSGNGLTCYEDVESVLIAACEPFDYTELATGPLQQMGYILPTYAKPEEGLHAIKLTIAQRAYLRHESPPFEPDKAQMPRLRMSLRNACQNLGNWARGQGNIPRKPLLDPLPDEMF